MDVEFRQEIQTELDRLYGSVQTARAAGQDRTEIEQGTNSFEFQWLERLAIEQRAESRGAKAGVEQAFEARAREADVRDAARLSGLTRDDQVAYWSSNRTGDGTSREAQRAQEMSQVVSQAQKQIGGEYDDLRYALVKSIQEIEAGRRPSLTRVLSEQVEKQIEPDNTGQRQLSETGRQTPETLQEYRERKALQEPPQERSTQEREAQEREQELQRQRTLER